ncbi:MAG: YfhO family protein [Patescibacteria group bacterium]|nr:YfhO family protein [Patescibacteria group bacterium]
MLKKILPFLFILLVVLGFFYKVIFEDHVLVDMSALSDKLPWSAYLPTFFEGERPPYTSSDSSTVYFPTFKFYGAEFQKGHFPLWWPYLTGGYPIFANSTSLMLSFTSPLFIFFAPEIAYSWSIIIKIFLAGIGFFLYLRLLKIKAWAGVFGALAYMLNTLVMLKLEIPWMTQTLWSIPFIFFCLEKVFQTRKFFYSALATVFLSLQFIAAHPQTGFYVTGFAFLYVLVKLAKSAKTAKNLKRLLVYSILPFILMSALAAVQLLPMLELQNLGHRSPNELAQWITPWHLLTALAPQVFGDTQTNFQAFAKIERNALHLLYLDFPPISLPYIGFLPFLFALITISKRTRRKAEIKFFLGISLFLVLLQIFTPLWAKEALHLPLINKMWNTYRANIIYVFASSVLAAYGLNYFFQEAQANKKRIFVILKGFSVVLVILLAFCLFLRLPWVKNLFLQTGEKISATYFLKTNPEQGINYYRNELLNWYQILKNHFSLFNTSIYIPLALLAATSALLILFYQRKIKIGSLKIIFLLLTLADLFYIGWFYNPIPTKRRDVFPEIPPVAFLKQDHSLYRVSSTDGWNVIFPNALANYNIADIGVEYNIYPLRYDEYMSFIENNDRANLTNQFHTNLWLTRYNSPLLDLFNVKYILTPPKQEIKDEGFKLVYNQEIKIYENQKALPRVFLVPQIEVITEDIKILERLNNSSFNPLKTAVFEETPHLQGSQDLQDSYAIITQYAPNQISIKTDLTHNGFLIFSDLYYPGWQVYIDGEKDKIYRANYLARGVALTQGEHNVVFKFEPKNVKIGAYISAGTFLLLIAIGIISLRQKRK